jgi:hypothetical protein
MKPTILIENNVFWEDEKTPNNSSLVASNYFKVIEVNNFLEINGNMPHIDFFRGSMATAATLRGFRMGPKDPHKFYDCTEWVPRLKQFYINKNYNFVDLEKCQDLPFPMFVRPCTGNKSFSGQLFSSKSHFVTEYNFTTKNRNVSQFDLCLYAKPKKIEEEYRCVFVDHKIVSACGYLKNGERANFSCPKEAIDLTLEIAKNSYFSIPNFVIDICKDSNGNYFLLEINSIYTSSFYSCDLESIYSQIVESMQMKYINPIKHEQYK